MKTPYEIESEIGEAREKEDETRRAKVLLRIEDWMKDAGPTGKSDDWYEGYDAAENDEVSAIVHEELRKKGWRGTFTRRTERMFNVFTGEPGGCGTRTILTVVPLKNIIAK